MHHLVGAAEIAELLGVTRQRVDAIARTHPDFPKPQAELQAGRVWLRTEVEDWGRKTGRLS
jgi:prophage regulatory protein